MFGTMRVAVTGIDSSLILYRAREANRMFTIWFTEGGRRLTDREWPVVPRAGEMVSLHESTGVFEVLRVHWEEHEQGTGGVAAHVSLRSTTS
jgi:hypothetical protein